MERTQRHADNLVKKASFLVILSSLAILAGLLQGAIGADSQVEAVAVQPMLSQLPVAFVENRGQLEPEVAYYFAGASTAVQFTPTGLSMSLRRRHERLASPLVQPIALSGSTATEAQPSPVGLEIELVGAIPVRPIGEQPTSTKHGYPVERLRTRYASTVTAS